MNDSSDLLLDRISANAVKSPTKRAVAFIAPGADGGSISSELSYAELETTTTALACQLLSEGIREGDRVVLVFPPSLDFMVAFLACLKARAIAVPVFPPHPARRDTLNMFSKIVESCGAKFALTNSEYNYLKKISSIKDAIKLKKTAAAWPEALTWIVSDDKAKGASDSLPYKVPPRRSAIAFLQYTSGSTSEPKGVMITQGNLAHNLKIITSELKAVDDTIVVSWLPQYHDMGLIGSYLGVLYCSGSGYYMSPLSFLQRPMLWIEAVSKYRGTHVQAPNFSFKLTARKFLASNYTKSSLNLSSVRHIINAAEPVDRDSIDTFYSTFRPFGLAEIIFPTYGLAEHTVFVCSSGEQYLHVLKKELEVDGQVVQAPADQKDSTIVSELVGSGFPENQKVDVKVVNTDTLQSVADDIVGEIWVNSPSKAAGYYNMPEETMRDFHATLAGKQSSDEYLRTGDLGFLHRGELFICGRLKDLIIVGGRNYYPQDIEATAEASSDKVRPGCSAAFTIDPTKEGGEEVALVMELKEAPKANEASAVCLPLANQIRGAINQEHSLGISEIVFLRAKTVPKTSSGKIARSWCRKGFIAGTLDVIFRHSFTTGASAFEIESEGGTSSQQNKQVTAEEAVKIRSMSKEEILSKLTADIARTGSIPVESVVKDAAIVTMLDSLTISQLKGLLENSYAVKLSDEYLFRESTTLVKLTEVVKLGYAPDDKDSSEGPSAASPAAGAPGKANGLAGMLGCPPGVVCTIL